MLRAAAFTLAIAIGVRADFIQTNFFLSTAKCSGQVFQSVAQLVGCTVQGSTASLRVSCINDTAATAAVFSTLDCTGPSQPIDVPFPSACGVAQGGSSQTVCKTGPYSALPLPGETPGSPRSLARSTPKAALGWQQGGAPLVRASPSPVSLSTTHTPCTSPQHTPGQPLALA
jgi:hypothetical protein